MVMLLMLPLMLPNVANAGTKGKINTSIKESPAKEKITGKLLKQFEEKDQVTFLIKFKEQVNTTEVAKQAEKATAAQNITSAKAKSIKRSSIVSSLRAVSIETQENTLKYLKKQEKAGKAKDIESFFIVNAIAVTATKDVMEQIASFPEVDKVLPNETRQLYQPEVKQNLAVEPKAKTNSIEWNVDRVGAPAVWEMGIDGSGTVVASIDTGVQWDHPALKEKYRGYNPANPDQPNHDYNWFDATAGRTTPYDDHGHGTHVTGTMVGGEANGSNKIGVAPGAKWIAVKAFTSSGGTDRDLLAAGEWILAPKDQNGNPNPEMAPDVVNNSWGGGPGLDEWYRPMVQTWRDAEIFPEFSAGNTNFSNPGGPGSIATPANYPESFATGATDINNKLAGFSLQGPSPYNEIKPEISAPGVNIRSSTPGNGYEGGWNGTSMAGPHVSAVVALLKQVNGNLTVDQIEEILMSTATSLTDSTFPESPNNGYGHGLVNAYDAVSSIMSGLGKIKGQVGKDGDDSDAPTFEHSSPQETYVGIDLPLTVTASDNVSVSQVTLEYKKSDGNFATLEAKRISGDYKNGTYRAVIPRDDIAEPSVTYKWNILDFGGNLTESEEYNVLVKQGISVGYFTDFESNPIGWSSFGEKDTWEWGVPTSGPKTAFSGEKVFATNLAGNYDNYANMSLVMPPIDLPEGNAFLQFKHWHELENRWDFAHVFVSTDMENWTQALRLTGNSNEWTDGEVDLSEYAGQRIYVAFNVTSDVSVQKAGWYLDDVRLTDTSNNKASMTNKKAKSEKTTGKKDTKAKKEKVNPDKILPIKSDNNEQEKSDKVGAAPALLPINAQVSVLETGRSTVTNPQNGTYELVHSAGDFTVQAEAYGFRSQAQRVTVNADGETTANFILEEIPKGTMNGVVTNELTGEPISGATLILVEDAAIQPVETNENGEFSITAYEGDYTIKVLAASFYNQEMNVTITGNETINQNIQLKPFIGYPGEIGYDDGSAENARAFYDAGNGWAVKMSLAPGNEKALVTGGLFRFWDQTWPTPGGNEFQVAVYDASGSDGAPGKKLAGPFEATALRDGTWTHVDLSGHGIMVDGDFYLVYIQTKQHPNAPGLATDENGEHKDRSWQLVSGAWSKSPKSEGNYMIRAVVNYEVTAPVITSPSQNMFTNEEKIVIKGTSSPAVTVNIFNNGDEVTAVEADEKGEFSAEVTLTEGKNELTAKASTENGSTDSSAPITVIYDKTKPELTIDSPTNGSKTNKEVITVEGIVADENLDSVVVNDKKASISDGKYKARIILDEGENTITVIAKDKAGNETSNSIKIDVKYTAPTINHLTPTEDKYLDSGDSIKIEFDSEPGLKATFTIKMPLTNTGAMLSNANELPIMETSPGHYVGYYTATKNVKAPGAEVEVIVTDDYGNEVRQIAEGKLYINSKK
ncbi:S8 family serine peptidase [Bacillus aquiflavi]|nr:S8 family serine peptidase [Bacillus aquiflavi]